MTPERWRRVSELFQSALDCDPGRRAEHLRSACGSDDELRREVESLVAAHQEAGTFGEHAGREDDDGTLGETAPPRTLPSGARLGPYEVLDLIAAGGMGEVYRARDARLGREVAVKVLPTASLADAGRLRRFHQEARAAGALNHPNILAVYDVGTEGAVPYVVSELLEGETLRARLARAGALPATEAFSIARQVAAGLAAAHERGILHRDLKPANLFLTRDGHAKILDFGLAKRVGKAADAEPTSATQPGVLLGTAGYMSPEQARGEPTDPRSDVFSFGAVLFEMLSGRRAFDAGSPVETLADVIDTDPDFAALPPGVPASLRDVARRCLEKERAHRFASARELQTALDEAASGPRAAAASASSPPGSVAVLPFLDLDADAGQEYLCDGLAEELIHVLARLPGLRVAARTSSFQFKGRTEGVRRIGERLGVARIVEGSVRRVGTRLRITVQLVDAGSGYQVWSERYDRELSDVFALQDEIAARVSEALKVHLGSALRGRPRPRDVEAYELYLKGRYFWNKRYEGELRKAVAAFEGAIARDPDYAPARAGLADALSVIGYYGLEPERDVFERARGAAERALALDPGSPEAHVSLALVQDWFDWNLPAAEESLRRALALAPDHVSAHLYLGHVLGAQGRGPEAVAAARAGAQLDPLSPLAHTLVGTAHYLGGEDAEAIDAVERVLELDAHYPPALLYVTLLESRRGRHEAAVDAARQAVEGSRGAPFFAGLLGWALARAGQRDEAQRLLLRLQDRARSEYVPAIAPARVAAALEDRALAKELLRQAIAQRNTWVVNLGVEPWPNVSDDPGWGELLAQAGVRSPRPTARDRAGASRRRATPSVAVLPFRAVPPDADDAHLGLGLADATITELASLGSLLVRPTSAVLRYHGTGADAREAGRALGVESVVEGTVHRSGDRVRVTVQLVEVDDGRPLWGTKVDASLADVFGMQDEVSARIAQALRVELAPAGGATSLRRTGHAPRPGAYQAYLSGKLALWRESLADCIVAVDWFEKARDADPEFALAWAGLADAYVRIAFEFQPEGDWYARAQAMCERALALDPLLPEARYVRARLRWSPPGGFDHIGAMGDLLGALAGRPSLDDAHVRLGVVLFHVGLVAEADGALQRALSLSPEHVIAMGHLGACRYHQGRFAEARDIADAAVRRNPSYWHQYLAAHTRLRLGDREGAASVADAMISRGEEGVSHGHAVHGLIAAQRGAAAAALRRVEQVVASKKSFGHYHHDQYDIACIHALLGDAAESLRWLSEVAANGYPCHPFFAIDPMLEGVRDRPAVRGFLDRLRQEDEGYARAYADLVGSTPPASATP